MKAESYGFYKKIERYAMQNAMLEQGNGIVAGVSGGADSMCLLYILHALGKTYGLRLVAVHVHHGIRGARADADEAFVRGECARLGILFEAVHADIPALATKWGCPQEEAGRRVRYEAFRKACAVHACQKIAVAHNENDNAETFLFQALRGSGLWGLAGIAPCRAEGGFTVIRPLLCASRAQIEAYLGAEGIRYRTDETNVTSDYARNRIRHELLPLAERAVNAGAVPHLAKAAEGMHELAGFVQEQVFQGYRKVAREGDGMPGHGEEWEPDSCPGEVWLDIPAWEALPAFLQKEVILYAIGRAAGGRRDIGRVHVQAVAGLMGAAVGKRVQLPCGLLASRMYGAVWIAPARLSVSLLPADAMPSLGAAQGTYPQLASKGSTEITSFPSKFSLGMYELSLSLLPHGQEYGIHGQEIKKNSLNQKNCYTKCFDYGKIRNTLVLRTRQAGDYVVINQDGSKKTLKSLLTDKKVPVGYRERLPLLAAGSTVLWVVGVRSGEGLHVAQNTKQVLVAELRRKDKNCDGREG